jgi:hypothetical protein
MNDTAPPPEPIWRTGLLGSLTDLSLRTSFIAIGVPITVVAIAYATGHRVDGPDVPNHPGDALLSVMIATFVLVPMFALAGATTALIVAIRIVLVAGPGLFARTLQASFLLAVATWAVLTAIAYDGFVVPRLTG